MSKHTKHQPLSETRFWFQRLAKTGLRALHIIGVVGAGGGILLHVDQSLWLPYWLITMTTGLLLMTWEIIRDWQWLIQLKGLLTLAKVGLLFLLLPFTDWQVEIITLLVLLSVIVSHGPAGLRHYSVVHRKVIHGKKEIKG
ncbi:hypothetical protein [Shewanella sp. OMA3-2]|uniref:hypothetical protein n=1 Tax=Shewanella sp. OMA3-2 TaxID=2908650 RepID=UPI001F18B71E|nr:hypothetical protein [Shewanella sp. OMA3-2]UJF22738.1 hypothetical protein L0B17_04925 [Shewanella sp. OMA3-2]